MARPVKSLIDQQFSRLTVKEFAGAHKGHANWKCLCVCGEWKIATSPDLVRGGVRSCGCLQREQRASMFNDLTGKKFGRLSVKEFVGRNKNGHVEWKCLCDCGTWKTISAGDFRNGNTQSCGCLHKEITSAISTTHGMSKSVTYNSWAGIISRCNNLKNHKYPIYGGRGIKVCDRWLSFDNFLSDMGVRPKGLSIERIDNDGNYEPENCKWATPKEQSNNRRSGRWININGHEYKLTQLATDSCIPGKVIRKRLWLGWSIERALSEPVRLLYLPSV